MTDNAPARGSRIALAIVVVVLATVLAAEILWSTVVAPRLFIRTIDLESDLGMSDQQLLDMLDLENETWASIDEAALQNRLESYPVVRRARVVKVFPDTLRLQIYRRRPLAVAMVGDPPNRIPAVFDEEGYAVQIGAGQGSLDLPVLTGPRFPVPELGSRLPESLRPVLADLEGVRRDDPTVFALVSEIEVVPRRSEGFDLKMYLNHVPIPILVDRAITVESIRNAVLVLDVLSSSSAGDVDFADMRGGHVVFRRSEES